MAKLFGIETEYGFSVEDRGAGDLMNESIALVRAYEGPCARVWNYKGEDPRRDMRGYRVNHLAVDPDDAQFDSPGEKTASVSDERNDLVLANGARFYNDHGHPEYATPECSAILDLVAHDKAGERIVADCAKRRSASLGKNVRIYKNNMDFHGASYGTHEGYLMSREVPAETLIAGLIPYLVTRQIWAGVGKVGVEVEHGAQPVFQLSQRADFFCVEASVDTLYNRPLVNTRDEPHATPSKYRRLHVIVGDANLSEWATAMKVGVTSLVLELLEDGWISGYKLRNPVGALKEISRDQTLQWLIELEDGRKIPAIDIQHRILGEAKKRFLGRDYDTDWIMSEWEMVLHDLDCDMEHAGDRVDWVAKRQLLEHFMAEEKTGWDDPIMQSLDLAYHNLDPEEGLYAGLEHAGAMRRLLTENRISAATTCAPTNTRAFIRGLFVKRFNESIRSIGWNGVAFNHNNEDLLFDMNPLVEENVSILNEEMDGAGSLDELVRIIASNKSSKQGN